MRKIEQRKMIDALDDFEARMTRTEQELYAMLRKRDRDDEDLDEMSMKKLVELHVKYAVRPKPKENPLDALFKKPPDSDT